MRSDNLTHTLTVRVPPSFRDDLAAAAEREDVSVGAFARRSLRLGLDDADARSMSPREALPREERLQIAMSALPYCDTEEGRVAYSAFILEELRSVQECSDRLMTDLAMHEAGSDLDGLAGYLRQVDLHIQRAAAGINGLRIKRLFQVCDAETRAEAVQATLSGEARQ